MDADGSMLIVLWILVLVITVFLIASMWKVFEKAGRPGWAAIVPIYNSWVGFEIAGKPGWWALIGLVPFVNIIYIVLWIIACLEIAKRFGKSDIWGFFMLFLFSFIGWPILGFGDAKYQAPGAPGAGGPAPAAPTPVGPTPAAPVQ